MQHTWPRFLFPMFFITEVQTSTEVLHSHLLLVISVKTGHVHSWISISLIIDLICQYIEINMIDTNQPLNPSRVKKKNVLSLYCAYQQIKAMYFHCVSGNKYMQFFCRISQRQLCSSQGTAFTLDPQEIPINLKKLIKQY